MSGLEDFRRQYPQYDDMPDKDLADRLYAKHYSDMPRGEFDKRMGLGPSSDPVVDATGQLVRGINRGLHSLAALPGEIVGGAVSLAGFPETGEAMRLKNNPVSKFMTSPDVQPETTLGRYANATGQAVGASAVPTGAMVQAAPRLAAMAPRTVGQAMVQRVAQPIAASPRAAIAADAVAATGGAVGSQSARDAGYGPGTQAVAGFAGALAPGAVAGGVSAGLRPVRRAMLNQGERGAYGRVVADLDGDIDGAARDIARGSGPGATSGRNREMALRILGDEMHRANGNVQQAQQATLARIVRETGVTPDTARTTLRSLTQMYQDSPLLLGEQPSIAGGNNALRGPGGGLKDNPDNVDLDDLNQIQTRRTQTALDPLANAGNAPSAQLVRNRVEARQTELAPIMREALANLPNAPQVNGRPATIVDADNMIEQARNAGRQAYSAAWRAPINNGLAMRTLPRLLSRYEGIAAGRAADKEAAILRATNQFYIDTPNGRIAMMTLQQMQDARGAVRGQISEYIKRDRDDLVQAVQPLYDHMTRLMSAMSPQWAQANRQWADMNFMRIGQDLGEAFSQRAGPQFRRQMREFQGLHPDAQQIVLVHFLQKQYDELDNLGDQHSVSKLFSNDHSRAAIQTLFGRQAAVDFTRIVRDMKAAERTAGLMGNSRTHIRGEMLREEQTDLGLVAANQQFNVGGLRQWLVDRGTQLLLERRRRPHAEILTTPMSNTAQVALHLERMRQQAARVQRFAQPRIRPLPAAGVGSPQLYDDGN